MPSFILRHLDPEFWARVQQKAAAENVRIKDLILRLLTAWLASVVILSLTACAAHLPNQPEAVTPEVQTTPASIRLTLASRPDRAYDVTATVLTADGHFVKDVALAFKMDAGTVTPETAMTNGNGVAQAVASTNSSTTLTVSAGALTSSTRVDGTPGLVAPPPPPPPPDPPAVGTIQLQAITTTVGVSTLFTVGAFMGSPIASEAWTFGDGGTAQTASTAVSHTYLTAGTFTATVTATDTLGRRASTSAPVTVNAAPVPIPPPPTPLPALSASLTCTPVAHLTATLCNVSATYGGNLVPANTITESRWEWGDGTLVDRQITPPTIPLGSHSYAQLGTYTLIVEISATTIDGLKFAQTSKVLVIP